MNKFLLKKYIAIVACIIGSFAVITLAAVLSHNFTAAGEADLFRPGQLREPNNPYNGDLGTDTENQPAAQGLPDFNMLILGLDDGTLPDVILVLMFNGQTSEINMISVPRDTFVLLTDEEWAMFREINRGGNIYSNGWLKLNEMHAHAGLANGERFLRNHLHNMLGIEIQHYAVLDLDVFQNIVDAVGGIYIDVRPQGMFYTPTDGTVTIRIEGGRQLLDGNQAMRFVRFREGDGDLGRIGRQQQFMQAFFTQALDNESIMSNVGTYVNTFVNQVRTSWGILDTLRYATPAVAAALNPESIGFHTLPGFADFRFNPAAGRNYSYFFVDVAEARQLIEEISTR